MSSKVVGVPDYDGLADSLHAAGITTSAAEAHGIITAALCAPRPPEWQRLLLGGEPAAVSPSLRSQLGSLYEQTAQQLVGIEFDFAPLLPTTALTEQVEALADWCRGFVLAMGAAGVDAGKLPGEAGEFMRDAHEIAEAQVDDDEAEETQQREYAEIVEYLRLGVQLVYEELHRLKH